MHPRPALHRTGDATLDLALGGGLPASGLVLLRGDAGAGALEFAFGLLRADLARNLGRPATLATSLRSTKRARDEMAALFEDEKWVAAADVQPFAPPARDLAKEAARFAGASLVVLESASFLSSSGDAGSLLATIGALGDAAEEAGTLLVLVCGESTLPSETIARLEEVSDAVLAFRWRHGGTMSRRVLHVTKVRGLAPVLDGEEVPIFEISVRRGAGVGVSRVTNVV